MLDGINSFNLPSWLTVEAALDIETEQALLGALLVKSDAFNTIRRLRPEHFGIAVHGRIFHVIGTLVAAGAKPDAATIKNVLGNEPALEERGGTGAYITALLKAAGPPINAPWYAKAIRKAARNRVLLLTSRNLAEAAADPSAAIGEVVGRAMAELPLVDDEDEPDPVDCQAGAWLDRDVPEPDFLIGPFSTTSRGLLSADTGLGKTNFCLALAIAMADGRSFLHWAVHRKARVIYIEGEMSKRLVKQRIVDAIRRLGSIPDGLYIISADDYPLPPLNTPEGQQYVDRFIDRAGGVDFVFFDNIQALLTGNMAEEEPWKDIIAWNGTLTRRAIGQLYIHHTGIDTTRSYGTKTREWQMDTVLVAEAVEQGDADIAFSLKFTKARERDRSNRQDFDPVTVTLQNDCWSVDGAAPRKDKVPSPLGQKFLCGLQDAMAAPGATLHQIAGRNAVTLDAWRYECRRLGLLDPEPPNRERALLSKYRRELIAINRIAVNGELVWPI